MFALAHLTAPKEAAPTAAAAATARALALADLPEEEDDEAPSLKKETVGFIILLPRRPRAQVLSGRATTEPIASKTVTKIPKQVPRALVLQRSCAHDRRFLLP